MLRVCVFVCTAADTTHIANGFRSFLSSATDGRAKHFISSLPFSSSVVHVCLIRSRNFLEDRKIAADKNENVAAEWQEEKKRELGKC